MVPRIYNADTLGIRPDLVGRDISTWADIMDSAFKGKPSILNIPSRHHLTRSGTGSRHDQGRRRHNP